MKNNFLKFSLLSLLAMGIIACKSDRDESDEDTSPIDVLKDSYTIDRFKVLNIVPNISGSAKLTWIIKDSATSGNKIQ